MKIFTEKGLREYIAKERYQEDLNRRLDELTAQLHELRWKVEALENDVRTPRTPVAINTDNAVKTEVTA